MTRPGSQGRNGASCGGGTRAHRASECPLPTKPWDWALASWRPWPPRRSLGAALGQLALQGATHHPALTLAGLSTWRWPCLPSPGVRGPHCLAWSGSDLTLWPGVTVCPHRISLHRQAGRALPLMPCGPPQSLHRAHFSRPWLRPDPLGGTLTSPLCLHPPTQGPPAPHTKPRLSLAHPRDLPAPCQEPPALGRCELLPEPQVTAAPQEGVKRGLRVFLSEEKGPLAPVCLCSCFPFPAQRAPHSCFWSPPARSLLLGNGFQPRRGIRGLDRRQHSRPRGGVTPHGARLRPTRPPRPSSDAWASSHEPLLRLLHCAVEA